MELHDAEEAMGIRKILARDIRMKKNPQTKESTFWIFKDFHGFLRVQSSTCTSHENFISGIANPELVCMLLRFQILCQGRSQGGDVNKPSLS